MAVYYSILLYFIIYSICPLLVDIYNASSFMLLQMILNTLIVKTHSF